MSKDGGRESLIFEMAMIMTFMALFIFNAIAARDIHAATALIVVIQIICYVGIIRKIEAATLQQREKTNGEG